VASISARKLPAMRVEQSNWREISQVGSMRWLARALRNGIAVQTEESSTLSLLSISVLAVEQLDHTQGIQRQPLVRLARLTKVDR
jgi:hypothetical protein